MSENPHPDFLRYLAKRQEAREQESGGAPFTLSEIDESIQHMEKRLESGQGQIHSVMCRLSLPMTRFLRGEVGRFKKVAYRAARYREVVETRKPNGHKVAAFTAMCEALNELGCDLLADKNGDGSGASETEPGKDCSP